MGQSACFRRLRRIGNPPFLNPPDLSHEWTADRYCFILFNAKALQALGINAVEVQQRGCPLKKQSVSAEPVETSWDSTSTPLSSRNNTVTSRGAKSRRSCLAMNKLEEFKDVFAGVQPWAGEVPKGYTVDFLGTLTALRGIFIVEGPPAFRSRLIFTRAEPFAAARFPQSALRAKVPLEWPPAEIDPKVSGKPNLAHRTPVVVCRCAATYLRLIVSARLICLAKEALSTRMTGQRSGICASCDELAILNHPPSIR